jgi:hypothetical protein
VLPGASYSVAPWRGVVLRVDPRCSWAHTLAVVLSMEPSGAVRPMGWKGWPNAIASEIQPPVAVEVVKEPYMVSWVVEVIKSTKEKRL